MKIYDSIVIGLGSMGASALYAMAKRGLSVLGLEQFNPIHQRGSHTGQSRIFRKAYFEHPDYVPLLQSAYHEWKTLESAAGEKLFFETGLLYLGTPKHQLLRGTFQSAEIYEVPLSEDPASFSSKFVLPPHFQTLHEPVAGLVLPEATISACLKLAEDRGADIHAPERLLEWRTAKGLVEIRTDKSSYLSRHLTIAAGAYSAKLIPGLAAQLSCTRQLLAYFNVQNPEDFALGRFPCWTMGLDDKPGVYYGFPILPADPFGNPTGMKVALHHVAKPISDPTAYKQPGIQQLPEDLLLEARELENLLQKHLPSAAASLHAVQTCLYTNSPDLDFILGPLPGHEKHVSIATGFSGHGFKFVPVIGDILADLAENGSTTHPIGFLSPSRFL